MKRKHGFTLIELMVVILLIGVLAALLLPAFSQVRKHAREQTMAVERKAMATAIRAYHHEYGAWPGMEPTDQRTMGWTNNNADLVEWLLSDSHSGFNIRSIAFWEERGSFLDPTGGYYRITINVNTNQDDAIIVN